VKVFLERGTGGIKYQLKMVSSRKDSQVDPLSKLRPSCQSVKRFDVLTVAGEDNRISFKLDLTVIHYR